LVKNLIGENMKANAKVRQIKRMLTPLCATFKAHASEDPDTGIGNLILWIFKDPGNDSDDLQKIERALESLKECKDESFITDDTDTPYYRYIMFVYY